MPVKTPLLIIFSLLSQGIHKVTSKLTETDETDSSWSPTVATEFSLSAFHLKSLAQCERLIVESLEQARKDVALNGTNEGKLWKPIHR